MAVDTIREAVHSGSRNDADIKVVQRLLNANMSKLTPLVPLTVDGRIGDETINAIHEFQKRVVGLLEPDGRVDPIGKTMHALRDVGHTTPPAPPKQQSSRSMTKVVITFSHHNRVPKSTKGMTSDFDSLYESDVSVSGGLSGSFKGSVWPDDMVSHKRILDGVYPVHIGFHQGRGTTPTPAHLVAETRKKPRAALLVNCRKAISATNSKKEKTTAAGVNIHNGWNSERGSEACLTISPGDWPAFIALFLNAFPSLDEWTRLGDRTGIQIGTVEVKA
jgi:hypothetical protein